jgi:hypothetical protein
VAVIPFMSAERWWGFVSGLRQAGVERIPDDIVIDNSMFTTQGDDRGSFDNRPERTYNVLPDRVARQFPDRDHHAPFRTRATRPARKRESLRRRTSRSTTACVSIPVSCRRGAGGIMVSMPEGRRAIASCCRALRRGLRRVHDRARGHEGARLRVRLFKTLWQQSGGTIGGGDALGTCRRMRSSSTPTSR